MVKFEKKWLGVQHDRRWWRNYKKKQKEIGGAYIRGLAGKKLKKACNEKKTEF